MKYCSVCGITEKDTTIHNFKNKGILYCNKHYQQMRLKGKTYMSIREPNKYHFKDDWVEMEIYNSNGEISNYIKISNEDYDRCKNNRWSIHSGVRKKLYGCGTINGKIIDLHRFILNAPPNKMVDHINGDTLDNRRENLRLCTNAENTRNRYLKDKNRVVGVVKTPTNKWNARITVNYERINLGTFELKEEAIKARLLAEKYYHKEFSCQQNLYDKYNIK
jgi:hypothetical protein